MNIVITTNYSPDSETGTAKVANLLSQKLSKKHKVLYICLGEKNEIIQKQKNLTIYKIQYFEVKEIKLPMITPFCMYEVFKYLDEFKPDIIHAQNPLFVSNLVQIWANINKVPFIVTFHHIPTEIFDHLMSYISKNILVTLVQEIYKKTTLKRFLEKSDAVIALNQNVFKSVRSINKKIPVEIIPNGIEMPKLKDNKLIQRFSLNNNQKINFIFLGSYNKRKNQSLLINTFSCLPESYHLNLYGNIRTNKEYYLKLLQLIKSKKINNVSLFDFTEKPFEALNKSNFFISASLKEAQSLAIIQAMAVGLPVIGIRNETTIEIINKHRGLLLKKNIRPSFFAKKIIEFVTNINYQEYSKNCIKASKKFDIEKVILKLENFYNRSTNNHR